jgi:hypothetical protein
MNWIKKKIEESQKNRNSRPIEVYEIIIVGSHSEISSHQSTSALPYHLERQVV